MLRNQDRIICELKDQEGKMVCDLCKLVYDMYQNMLANNGECANIKEVIM